MAISVIYKPSFIPFPPFISFPHFLYSWTKTIFSIVSSFHFFFIFHFYCPIKTTTVDIVCLVRQNEVRLEHNTFCWLLKVLSSNPVIWCIKIKV